MGGLALLAAAGLGVGAHAQSASILYVDDGARPNGNGLAWATAYPHLQDALAVAALPGSTISEIRVAGGEYRPDLSALCPGGTGWRLATFRLDGGIWVGGGYAGPGNPNPDDRDFIKYETVLTGDLMRNDASSGFAGYDENSYHVVTMHDAYLEGVTVIGGNANETKFARGGGIATVGYYGATLVDCTIVRNRAMGRGGGVHGSAPLWIQRALVLLNEADNGGGVYAEVSARVNDSVFQGNRAAVGGAMSFTWDLTAERCVFSENAATRAGGAVGWGEPGTHATFIDCRFEKNTTDGLGGAVCTGFEAQTDFVNCSFRWNSAFDGGAIYNDFDIPMNLVNCEIVGNVADARGGGICLVDSNMGVQNCTIVGNTAAEGGGIFAGHHTYISGCGINNCIVWYNEATTGLGDQIMVGPAPIFPGWGPMWISVVRSDLQGGVDAIYVDPDIIFGGKSGFAVIDEDPHFLGGSGGMTPTEWAVASVRLYFKSPAVDAGTIKLVASDDLDLDWDGDREEPIPFDLDGRDRFVDATGTGRPLIDLGAFEWQFCPADLDGSRDVDELDLREVAASWGPCLACAADLNTDGNVDLEDIIIVLNNWGSCP